VVTLVLAPQTGRGLDGVCRTGRQRRWASSLLLGLSVVSFLAMAGELSGEASALLRRLGLDERVGPVFAREGIDGYSLPFVSVEDLVGVGVATEDARRIVSAVAVPEHADKKVRGADDANGEPVAKPALRTPLLTLAENGATTGSAIDLLRDHVGGRTVVERAAPAPAPRLEWRRFFPQLGVSLKSDGSGLSFLPLKEASPVASLLLKLDLLKKTDRDSISFMSDLVVEVVGEARHVISECGYDWSPEMQQHLETSLNSSANVRYALRYATIAWNYLDHKVLGFLAPDAAPLDLLATVKSTKRGAFRDSYDQIGLLHKLVLIFSRFPLEMQKEGGLGAVHHELRRLRESPPPPTSAASLSSVGTTPSATIVAADSSSFTGATSSSAPDVTMEPVCPPLPPVPPTSSSLDATPSSQQSVAPTSSLTNNVKLTPDTAASSKAPLPSDCALALLLRNKASQKNKDSIDTTAMVVVEKSSAPDPQVLAELLKDYSLAVPDHSKTLTKKDVKKGDVLYIVQNDSLALCRVQLLSGGYVHVKDSTNNFGGAASKFRPGMLKKPSQTEIDSFPSTDGPWTTEPLRATPLPPPSLPQADIIIRVVGGTCSLLAERDFRLSNFGDTDRLRLQSSVETERDAYDILELAAGTLDRVLSSISVDRVRTLGRDSLRNVTSECQPLVLLKSLRSSLNEWAKVPEHEKPPLTSAPVAQASVDVITEPRERKTTELFANDPDSQKSSYGVSGRHAQNVARSATESSCAGCGAAFTFRRLLDVHRSRWTCIGCKKIFCSECTGFGVYFERTCRSCKFSEPIDVVKTTQGSGSLVHGPEARLRVADRIRLAFGEEYELYCKYMGPAFGGEAWYELEVLSGAYESDAACRRFTKSTIGSAQICIDRKNRGVFAAYDDFWDYCREPGETPLQVAKRMTVEVHPGFEVIAGLIEWGVLDYLDGENGGFVGGWRMVRLRDVHGVTKKGSMPTVADFMSLPYQECLKRRDDLAWPTPAIDRPFCEFGAEELERCAIPGPDVPPARLPAQGPGSRNHAPETLPAIVADRADRDLRERNCLKFLLDFKAGRLHDPALQVATGFSTYSGWLSIACADCSLGPDQHIKQQTPLYLAAVRIRELTRENETRGPFILHPLLSFLNTGVGDGSDLDKLRGRWNVFMGCTWRARYRETPTSEYKYVQLPSVWKAFDPAARNAGLEALPAPSFRAPRSRK
jgi:hypothetical protein